MAHNVFNISLHLEHKKLNSVSTLITYALGRQISVQTITRLTYLMYVIYEVTETVGLQVALHSLLSLTSDNNAYMYTRKYSSVHI